MVSVGSVLTSGILLIPFIGYFYGADKIYPGCAGLGTPCLQRKLLYWLGFVASFAAFISSVYWNYK